MGDRSQPDLCAPVAAEPHRRLALLMAVDENYSAPLAICVASLLDRLAAGITVDLFLIGPGLAPPTLSRLAAWWGDRVVARECPVSPERLEALRATGDGSPLHAHLRALLASALPEGVSKVLYLDADILIQRDVWELWQQDMQGNIILAVQDTYVQELPRYCLPAGEAVRAKRPYFNSGVMVIDVDAWRAGGVEAAYFEELRTLAARSRWADQDALNACLVDRWGALPPVWNRQFALGLYPDWRCSPHSEEEFREARSAPAIVHFNSRTKPWHRFSDHPEDDVRRFRSWLRRVPWDVGPGGPPTFYETTLERLSGPHRIMLDSVSAAVRSGRRKHALATMLPGILRHGATYPWTLLSVPLSVLRDRVG